MSCKEEAKPGAGGRGGMLASQEEPNQHPNNFIISQGLTIPSRKGERGGRKGREEGEGGRGGRKGREEGEGGVMAVNVVLYPPPCAVCRPSLVCSIEQDAQNILFLLIW